MQLNALFLCIPFFVAAQNTVGVLQSEDCSHSKAPGLLQACDLVVAVVVVVVVAVVVVVEVVEVEVVVVVVVVCSSSSSM